MAAAAPALIPATIGLKEALKEGAQVLTGDLVVFRGVVHRKREEVFYGPDRTPKTRALRKHTREVLEPVDVELHVNPLTLLVGTGAALVGAVGATIAWHGLKLGIPGIAASEVQVFRGLKDTLLGKDLTAWYLKRRIIASGGTPVSAHTNLTPEEIQEVLETQVGDAECQLLNREWAKAHRAGRFAERDEFLRQARERGCPWVFQI